MDYILTEPAPVESLESYTVTFSSKVITILFNGYFFNFLSLETHFPGLENYLESLDQKT